jgi:hypothetical protein
MALPLPELDVSETRQRWHDAAYAPHSLFESGLLSQPLRAKQIQEFCFAQHSDA